LPADFYHWLVLASLKACVILPLVLLAVFFSRRTSSSVIHVLVTCALLWIPLSPFLDFIAPGMKITVPLLEKLDAFPEDQSDLAAFERENPLPVLRSSIVYVEESTLTMGKVMLILWATGALVFLLVRLWKSMNAKLRMTRAHPVAEEHQLYHEFKALCQSLGMKNTPWLLCNDLVHGAQVTGLLTQAVMIPSHFGQYPPEQRQMMMIHELAHIRRRDTQWRTLLELIAIIFWFHPLVWLMLRRHDEQTEKACDDAVLHFNYPPAQYAETMLAATKPPQLADSASKTSAPAGLRDRMFAVLNKEKHRLPMSRSTATKFALLFSLAIFPLGLVSFTPFSSGKGYEVIENTDTLRAAWRMKLGRGSILPDSSGGENHGKIYGAQWITDAERGSCLSFDGVDDHLILRAPEMDWTPKPFSLCVWLKPADDTGGGLLLRGDRNQTWCSAFGSKNLRSYAEREFLLSGTIHDGSDHSKQSNGIQLTYNAWGTALAQSEAALTPNKWNHIAFTWRPAGNSALVQMYLNGKVVGVRHTQAVKLSGYGDWPAQVWYFGLGESPISADNNYEGLVSDLAVYQKALNKNEIQRVMQGDFALKNDTPKK